MVIKRATILKHLKHHGKYERGYFSLKKKELEDICNKLGIDLTQDIENKEESTPDTKPEDKPGATPDKKPVKSVVIQEPPDDSSSDDDDDEADEPADVPVVTAPPQQQPPTPPKKLKRRTKTIPKVKEQVKEQVEEQVEEQVDNRKIVNDILKDLNRAIKELFDEFDSGKLDQDDVLYVQSEFNVTLNEAQDLIDPLIENFSDSEVNKIESKLDLMYRKLDRFLM